MRNRKLDQTLRDIAEGFISPADAAESLRMSAYDDIDFAKLDTNRELRTGRGEVVFGLGKTPEQVARILRRMTEHAIEEKTNCHSGQAITNCHSGQGAKRRDPESISISPILATKATPEHYAAAESAFIDGFLAAHGLVLEYHEAACLIAVRPEDKDGAGDAIPEDTGAAPEKGRGLIAVVTGGTADIPVAEEAAVTAELYGHEVLRVYDVGISGLHRLLDKVEEIRRADVVIAVAGMEGALASVLSGLVSSPVVAVPTSVGYGITLSGLTPLFAMLGSCSLGIGVMNIDNGFGAAHYASMILGVRE